jgi:hypothetical protein
MKELQEELTQDQILLRAAYQILEKQNNTSYVLNVLEQTSVWDGVTCDGGCLLEEIGNYLDSKHVDADYVPEIAEGES